MPGLKLKTVVERFKNFKFILLFLADAKIVGPLALKLVNGKRENGGKATFAFVVIVMLSFLTMATKMDNVVNVLGRKDG